MTPSRNTRSYTLRSVPSSPGRSFFHYRGRSGSPPLLVLPASEFSYKICSALPNHLPHDFCSRCFGVNFSFQIPEAQTIRLYGVNLPNRRQSEIWKGAPTLDDYSNLLRKTLQVAKAVQKIQTKSSRKLMLRDTGEPTFWLTPWAPTLQWRVPVVLYFLSPLSYIFSLSSLIFPLSSLL